MFCTYCGKQIANDSRFCCYCGKTLNNSSVSNLVAQKNEMPVARVTLSNSSFEDDKESDQIGCSFPAYKYNDTYTDKPVYNFVMHFVGPSEPRDCEFSIYKNAEDDWDDEEEIDSQEITVSKAKKVFEYELDDGTYTIYVNSYTREVKIKNGEIVDFTFDCSGFFNQIYINERSEEADNMRNGVPSSCNGANIKTTVNSNNPSPILFTLHMIGPKKPVQFKYQITYLNNLHIIDKGAAYAVSTDNKLTYKLMPGKYEVKIDRYTRIVNVGEANDVDFIFDCSHHYNSIQILGDLKG